MGDWERARPPSVGAGARKDSPGHWREKLAHVGGGEIRYLWLENPTRTAARREEVQEMLTFLTGLILTVGLIVCAWAAGVIYDAKGRMKGNGQGLGCLLGPLGVLIALAVPENRKGIEERELASGQKKKCPFCAELIRTEARVCRYCGRDVS